MVFSFHSLSLLHAGVTLGPASFTVHPSTVIGILALAALYSWRLRVGHRNGLSTSQGKTSVFAVTLLALFLSINGWLHDLSDYYLFSAHMVQHLLLALVVAPLLIMATPGWMLRPALAARAVASTARWVTNPLHSFAIFNVVLAAWHLPPLHNLAL